jgi:hypothetical protein
MAIEFKWSVNKVKVIQDNLIVQVELIVTANDEENTASAAYTCDLVRGNSFIPYEQLTEQQVLDWCFEPKVYVWKDIDGNDQQTIKYIKADGETQVTGQLERQLAQKAAEPALPWVEIPA